MLSFNSNTYMLALAALPCLVLGAQAAHVPLEARDEAALLFAGDGPQLEDIAIIGSGKERDEKASIVAQCLIVTRKLNSSWIDVYFKDYDGETETKAETTAVMPYWHRHESEDTEKALQVDHVKAKADATAEGLAFGSSETAPWWPYAILSGIKRAGWPRPEAGNNGVGIAIDALNLVTGYSTENRRALTDMKYLEKSDFTPILLAIERFDETKPERSELKLKAPRDLRWEAWVTVMSYDDSTKILEYATSYLGPEEKGISQWIHIDDVTIKAMVTLAEEDDFTGRVGDVRTSTQPPPPSYSTQFAPEGTQL